MRVIEINNKDLWNKFVLAQGGDFLESWEWKELEEALGEKAFPLAVIDDALDNSPIVQESLSEKDLLAIALVIRYRLPFKKSYLYCPHGPIVKREYKIESTEYKIIFESLMEKIKKIAKRENSIFFRLDPLIKETEIGNQKEGFLKEFRKTKKRASAVSQPKLVWQLDISLSEEEILSQMKQKTRYNIRLAEKKGVKVEILIQKEAVEKNFEIFYKLLKETAKRDKFYLHPKEHYKKIIEIFSEKQKETLNPKIVLLLAKYKEESLATLMLLVFGDQAMYLYGGSAIQKKNLMAGYLIQWEAIKEAKRRNCKIYNFGAIALDETQNWYGMTRFKKGFGGKEVEYIGTYDLIFEPTWYIIYKLGRIFKKIRIFR